MQRRQFLWRGVLIAAGGILFEAARGENAPPADAAADAARAAGEPTLAEICGRMGYGATNLSASGAIKAFQFRRAQPGFVRSYPLAAYGQPKECASGWYGIDNPDKRITLWKVDGRHQKQDNPPTESRGTITFDPKDKPFGLWVASKSFPGETIDTDDGRNSAIVRFGSVPVRKVRLYAAVSSNGVAISGSYVLGWTYSVNDDFQDIVTILENVQPIVAPTSPFPLTPSVTLR